ncbi:MAG: hypothetical protein EPN21_19730 [Methylococcaceae bacterium]|nr:MAG: hypothetical protein EPN21_19730 [Methylococcaceae bacterium]
METQTIDHATLARLVESGSVRAAHVIGQTGGWEVIVNYGTVERPLAAQRSGKVRLFRKLETITAYLRDIGINRFDVDASAYQAGESTPYKRPDRAEALKQAHAAAAHDRWFREQVQQALDEADKPDAVFIPHEVVMAEWEIKRAELLQRAQETPPS